MEIIKAQLISAILYISHAYGELLAHERRKTQGDHHKINRVQVTITIVIHSKSEDQAKFKSKYE
jgi:hypothetical protein